ncbi:RNA-directed DNA polymerase, eukaryota [Tanacetum coccineum]
MAVMPHSKQVALLISTIGWLLCPFDLNKLSLAMANRFRNGFESGRETRNNIIEASYAAHPTPGKDFKLMKFFSAADVGSCLNLFPELSKLRNETQVSHGMRIHEMEILYLEQFWLFYQHQAAAAGLKIYTDTFDVPDDARENLRNRCDMQLRKCKNKDISVADKMNTSISSSFRRHVRGGVESQQLDQLSLLLDTVILSNMDDRWFWDLNGDGVFQVKDVRSMLDEAFLPKMEVPTRWIKSIPIKVNVFAWKLYLDRLPTRSNLSRRNVSLPSLACPLCDHVLEDSSHLFFGCSVAKDIQKLICRWWNLDVHPYESYED